MINQDLKSRFFEEDNPEYDYISALNHYLRGETLRGRDQSILENRRFMVDGQDWYQLPYIWDIRLRKQWGISSGMLRPTRISGWPYNSLPNRNTNLHVHVTLNAVEIPFESDGYDFLADIFNQCLPEMTAIAEHTLLRILKGWCNWAQKQSPDLISKHGFVPIGDDLHQSLDIAANDFPEGGRFQTRWYIDENLRDLVDPLLERHSLLNGHQAIYVNIPDKQCPVILANLGKGYCRGYDTTSIKRIDQTRYSLRCQLGGQILSPNAFRMFKKEM